MLLTKIVKELGWVGLGWVDKIGSWKFISSSTFPLCYCLTITARSSPHCISEQRVQNN